MHGHANLRRRDRITVGKGVKQVDCKAWNVVGADVLDDRIEEIQERKLCLWLCKHGALLNSGDDSIGSHQVFTGNAGEVGDDILRVERELRQKRIILKRGFSQVRRYARKIEMHKRHRWRWRRGRAGVGEGWGIDEAGVVKHGGQGCSAAR